MTLDRYINDINTIEYNIKDRHATIQRAFLISKKNDAKILKLSKKYLKSKSLILNMILDKIQI